MVASALGVAPVPSEVNAALLANPEAMVKIKEIEATNRVEIQRLVVTAEANRLAAETAAVNAINATMQAEAASDHWQTYSWRPFLGFCVGLNTLAASILVLVVFVPIMFGNLQAAAAVAGLPLVIGALAGINGTLLPILGIASYFRGKAQADPNIQNDVRG
jgi:roadblock/LC7 domain-containing protein